MTNERLQVKWINIDILKKREKQGAASADKISRNERMALTDAHNVSQAVAQACWRSGMTLKGERVANKKIQEIMSTANQTPLVTIGSLTIIRFMLLFE